MKIRKDHYFATRMKPQLFTSRKRLKRMPVYYLVVVLLTLLPLLLSALASAIGNGLGCNINEGGTDECVRWGIHFGALLNVMFTSFWLALLTVPAGIIALLVLTFAAINDTIYYRSNPDIE